MSVAIMHQVQDAQASLSRGAVHSHCAHATIRCEVMPRRTLIAVLLLMPLLCPAAAAAVPPTRSEVEESFTVVYEPCGLTEVGERHRSFTTFHDQDGREVRTLEQVFFEGTITNPTTGATFVDRGHATVMFEAGFANGFTLLGTVYNVRVPGEGLVLLDVGRLVVDANFNPVFQSAKVLSLAEIDAAVCDALG